MKVILEAPSHREQEAESSRKDQLNPIAVNKSSANLHADWEKIQEAIVKATAVTTGKLPQNIELSKTAAKKSRTSRVEEEEKVSSTQVKEKEGGAGA